MDNKDIDSKKRSGTTDSLSIIRKYAEEDNFEVAPSKLQRTYKEAVYYAVIQLCIVIAVGFVTTYSTISYLQMPLETYHTTNYTGEIRTLSPAHVEKRK